MLERSAGVLSVVPCMSYHRSPLSPYPAGILLAPLRPLIIPSQAAPRKAFQCIFPDRVKRAIGDNIIPAAYLYSVSLAHSFVGEGDLLILLPHIPPTRIQPKLLSNRATTIHFSQSTTSKYANYTSYNPSSRSASSL